MKTSPDPKFSIRISGGWINVSCTVDVGGEEKTALCADLIYPLLFEAALNAPKSDAENMISELGKILEVATLRSNSQAAAKLDETINSVVERFTQH